MNILPAVAMAEKSQKLSISRQTIVYLLLQVLKLPDWKESEVGREATFHHQLQPSATMCQNTPWCVVGCG